MERLHFHEQEKSSAGFWLGCPAGSLVLSSRGCNTIPSTCSSLVLALLCLLGVQRAAAMVKLVLQNDFSPGTGNALQACVASVMEMPLDAVRPVITRRPNTRKILTIVALRLLGQRLRPGCMEVAQLCHCRQIGRGRKGRCIEPR